MWTDVDFKQRLIYVRDTKGGEPRELPINKLLYETLHQQPRKLHSPYVFANSNGKPYVCLRKSFAHALKKAGIERPQRFRFHDLRHTFASQLVMNGVPLITVKELLGHKSIEMTMRYAHLSQDHRRKAVNTLLENRHQMDTTTQAATS